ncbi:MAG: FeS cluster assembly protein SufD [Chlamydiia bacterium]|nr:FeS cluster assembly protein SufD [Chlamydiia bacterium]
MFLEALKNSRTKDLELLRQLKERAQKKVFDSGFPTKKAEDFKYIDMTKIETCSFELSEQEYSFRVLSDKVEVLPLEKALDKYGVFITNTIEKMGNNDTSFFSSVNQGWGDQTYCIFVNESVEEVIEIIESCNSFNQMHLPRLLFFVKSGAKASFHHKFELKGSGNIVLRQVDVTLERNAHLSFYETSNLDHDNDVFFHTSVIIKKDAEFKHKSGTLGCKTFRNEIKSYLLEERASCSLEGFWNGNDDQSIHHLVLCSHLAEETKSRQHYQGVCANKARASFEGQIYVDKVAQKTDSYQLSKQLLIGEKSRAFCKPNLEVFADDVIASHGATVSMLSEEELFYLTSRGVCKDEAASLLKQGFLSFFIDDIDERQVKKSFLRLI